MEEIEDQKILVYIAKNDEDEVVRKEALKKLQEQKLWADVAQNAKVQDVRIEGERVNKGEKLSNKGFLKFYLKNF